MISGLPWADLYTHLADKFHWPPPLVLDGMAAGQLWPFLPHASARRPYDPDRVRDEINRRRLAKGLPPMKPRA